METILKPTEKEMETLTEVTEITGVDYNGKEWHQDITPKSLIEALADMVVEYHKLQEELEEQQEHCEEYHTSRRINYYDEYGISERQFH